MPSHAACAARRRPGLAARPGRRRWRSPRCRSGSSGGADRRRWPAARSRRWPPDGPPQLEALATAARAASRCAQRADPQGRVTAIVYHGIGDRRRRAAAARRATRCNAGFLARVCDTPVRRRQQPGARATTSTTRAQRRRDTGSVDVGAPAGTTVYAPVDGVIVAMRPYVLNGKHVGQRSSRSGPTAAPAVIVTVAHSSCQPAAAGGRPGDGVADAAGHGRRPSRRARSRRSPSTRRTPATTSHSTLGPAPGASPLPVRILFIADIFAAPGRRIVEQRLPATARGARPRPRGRQRRERRRRRGHHQPDRQAAARRRASTRSRWATTPPPARGLPLPRQRAADHPPGQPAGARRPAAAATVVPAADGTPVAVVNLLGRLLPGAGRQPVRGRPPELVAAAPARHAGGAGRLPRRGDQREGRDGPAAGRLGDGGRSAPTRTSRPTTRRCCPAAPPT